MKPLLHIDRLHAGYGPLEVLSGVTLEVRPGEIVALIGANGAGKTTTLMAVSGLVPVRAGYLLLDGIPLHDRPPHVRVAEGLCQVPEGRKIFPRLTVRENLEMGAFVRPRDGAFHDDLGRVFSLFPVLRERERQMGGTLSGGEQQMLAIARALMARPRLLLLDEPSLGLAPLLVAKVFDTLAELNRAGMTLLLVEQNARQALRLAHRGYVLEKGQIALSGAGAELLHNPRVVEAYLGG
jgi:branched-chain amino acid transport system ATP-binding protein